MSHTIPNLDAMNMDIGTPPEEPPTLKKREHKDTPTRTNTTVKFRPGRLKKFQTK